MHDALLSRRHLLGARSVRNARSGQIEGIARIEGIEGIEGIAQISHRKPRSRRRKYHRNRPMPKASITRSRWIHTHRWSSFCRIMNVYSEPLSGTTKTVSNFIVSMGRIFSSSNTTSNICSRIKKTSWMEKKIDCQPSSRMHHTNPTTDKD